MYNYLENVARLEVLRDDLRALDAVTVRGQNYEERTAPDGYIDNIPGRILKIDALESLIAGIERRTKPVARLIADLESPYNLSPERQDMLGILRVRYLHRNTWDRTISHLKMRRETFIERRKQLVQMAIRYLGLESRPKEPTESRPKDPDLKPDLKADLKPDLFLENR
jgi:hypothetical protein